jgi:hypothetical protein
MVEIFNGILEWEEKKNKSPQQCYGIVLQCPKCKRRIITFKNGTTSGLAQEEA